MSKQIKDKADIFGENFKDMHLSGKKIVGAEFDDCTFVSCDFSSTFFQSCTFRECRFEKCNLSLLKLTDTKIGDVGFISSKLIGIDWTMCNWESLLSCEGLRFQTSILDGSNFFGLNLDGLILQECSVRDSDFQKSSLKNGNFMLSDFEHSLFHDTDLQNANFTGAKNITMQISSNHFKNTKIDHFQALNMLEFEGIIVK
jgi:fluoroquinolone resistance protein